MTPYSIIPVAQSVNAWLYRTGVFQLSQLDNSFTTNVYVGIFQGRPKTLPVILLYVSCH